MESGKVRRLAEALQDLERCLDKYTPSTADERSIFFIALTKAFETGLEYAWKELKRQVEDRGLEANAPKDAAREAAQLGIIKDPELWIRAINARNLSVHDYFSLEESEFVELIRRFAKSARTINR